MTALAAAQRKCAVSKARAALLCGVALLVASACQSLTPSSRPRSQVISTVGVVEDTEEHSDRLVIRLVGGQVWERPKDQFRIIYQAGSSPTLFVAGLDSKGTYVLLIGSLPGLPQECRYALGVSGRDWGDAVEAGGSLWPKAPNFRGSVTVGMEYPKDVRFCLNDHAQVESAVVPSPSEGTDSVPSASVGG